MLEFLISTMACASAYVLTVKWTWFSYAIRSYLKCLWGTINVLYVERMWAWLKYDSNSSCVMNLKLIWILSSGWLKIIFVGSGKWDSRQFKIPNFFKHLLMRTYKNNVCTWTPFPLLDFFNSLEWFLSPVIKHIV